MGISGLSGSFPMAMPQDVRPVRAANAAGERAGASTDMDPVAGDRAAGARAQAAIAAREPLLTTRASQDDNATREAREAREALVQATAGGGFRFEMEGRVRVMKVLDSKDVLIYQVPPKGKLEIIESQDQAAPPRVSTRV